jgi:hypothetical protein
MSTPRNGKRLRLRRPDRCTACERDIAAGETAVWNPSARTVTCAACSAIDAPEAVIVPGPHPVVEGAPGTSALREYQRRHQKREDRAREKLGYLGVFLARAIDKPQSTRVWQQGGLGEVRAGERLAKHLAHHGVRLLHDRQVPGHGRANIDHIAVGPGGVTVIDTKTHKGKLRLDRIGGLFSPRRTVLLIGGRDQTKLIDGIERQVGYVSSALEAAGYTRLDVRGALCFPNVDGLPLFSQLMVRDIVIDGPEPVSKLARRTGTLDHTTINAVWERLGRHFPSA